MIPLQLLSTPLENGLVDRKMGCVLSPNFNIISSAILSHFPCGLSALKEYHHGHVVEGQWHHRHHMQQKVETCAFSLLFPCFPCVSLILSSFSVGCCVCDVVLCARESAEGISD